jgi:hypothetical protein
MEPIYPLFTESDLQKVIDSFKELTLDDFGVTYLGNGWYKLGCLVCDKGFLNELDIEIKKQINERYGKTIP